MGYPDGWNQLAYCNNGVTSAVDLWRGAFVTCVVDNGGSPSGFGSDEDFYGGETACALALLLM